MDILQRTGKKGIAAFHYAIMLLALFYMSIRVIWTNRDMGQRDFVAQVMQQIYFTGVQAVPLVMAVAAAVGTFTIMSAIGGMNLLVSGSENVGRLVTVLLIREIAPLVTGGIVIVRSATAIATELGVMRVQREIEALDAMGISPVRQLITPRVFGGFFSFVGLNVIFSGVALFVGFAIAQTVISIPPHAFFKSTFSAFSPFDLLGLGLKLGIGGVGIPLIACYHGMSVEESSTEVPVQVSRASLNALVFLLILAIGISLVMLLFNETAAMLGGFL